MVFLRRIWGFVILLTISHGSFPAGAQKLSLGNPFLPDISAEFWLYRSFSQQKTSFPMKAGYPVLKTALPALGLHWVFPAEKSVHFLTISVSLPGRLVSDNGTGNDYLTLRNRTGYFRTGLDYALDKPLFRWKFLEARHQLQSGLLYESRILAYHSGAMEITRDIQAYLGPGLHARFHLLPGWQAETFFDARFYLPWLNYGYLESFDEEKTEVYSSVYRGFYYHTLTGVSVTRYLAENRALTAGFTLNHLVGFANTEPLFYMSHLVHFKLDRMGCFFVRVTI